MYNYRNTNHKKTSANLYGKKIPHHSDHTSYRNYSNIVMSTFALQLYNSIRTDKCIFKSKMSEVVKNFKEEMSRSNALTIYM